MRSLKRNSMMKLTAIGLLALPLALSPAPAFSVHTCVPGTDDYDQCVVETEGDEPTDLGLSEEDDGHWRDIDDEQ
ncbi:MAG: hypothetical protein F4X02_06630 [Chloroflexi bacterium]|nr:hypothetical protein [Chloroflexota bacterium]